MSIIEPRTLKGFRDYPPALSLERRRLLRIIEDTYLSFGFAPLDTPALEYAEILLGKGSDEHDKQMFRFNDQGGRDVALRFDLTVPLARFAAQHIGELTLPFKCMHIGSSWRADKPQKGRFREFIQCDVDILGVDSRIADAEVLVALDAVLNTLEIPSILRINNRKLLNDLLAKLKCEGALVPVLRAIDKLEKLGREVVEAELSEAKLSSTQISELFGILAITSKNLSTSAVFSELEKVLGSSLGLLELQEIFELMSTFGVSEERAKVDLSITRGLDYYTGVVVEVMHRDLPTFGSLGGGGRYDNLVNLYSKRSLVGVGGSIGLDRLLAAQEELGLLPSKESPIEVFVPLFDESAKSFLFKLATTLRQAGISTEVALEVGKLGNQLKLASKRGARFAVIAGEREISQGVVSIKDLKSESQIDGVKLGEVATSLQEASLA